MYRYVCERVNKIIQWNLYKNEINEKKKKISLLPFLSANKAVVRVVVKLEQSDT